MPNPFFERPILNGPYEYPNQHWELDGNGQPTEKTINRRRPAQFITPIPKPRKRKDKGKQVEMIFDEGLGLSTDKQRYDQNPIINLLREEVTKWRNIPDPAKWKVTPETARL